MRSVSHMKRVHYSRPECPVLLIFYRLPIVADQAWAIVHKTGFHKRAGFTMYGDNTIFPSFRSCINSLKPFHQSAKGGNGTNLLSRTDRYFIIFERTAGVIAPRQRTLNKPPLWKDIPYRLDARRNIDAKPQFTGNILDLLKK